LDKKTFVQDNIRKNMLEDLKKISSSSRDNSISYSFFNKMTNVEKANIFPLSIRDNKNIAELMEDLPQINEKDLEKSTDKQIQTIIKSYKNKVDEIQENLNNLLSDKVEIVSNGKKSNIDMSKIDILDYQFIVLNIFSVANNSIKHRTNLNDFLDEEGNELRPDYLSLEIPLEQDILNKIKNFEEVKITKSFDKVKKKKVVQPENSQQPVITTKEMIPYKVEFEYIIKKLNYNKGLIEGDRCYQKDIDEWHKNYQYSLRDNIDLIFRPVNITDYLKLYNKIFELQVLSKANKIKKYTNFLLDMNTDFIKDIVYAIHWNDTVQVVSNDEELKGCIAEIIDNLSEKDIIDLISIIYGNILRLEIDIKVFDQENNLVKEDAWFDTGMSFFFNY
jgi:hypothetical protein